MNKNIKRKLELLDQQIQSCKDCNLYENGRVKPFWTEDSKYMIISESPNINEIYNNELLTGDVYQKWWDIVAEYHLLKKDFLIMNCVNCRVLNGNKNGKPSEYHRDCCKNWIRKYIKVFQPKKIMLMGNYAINVITNKWGVTNLVKKGKETVHLFDMNIECIYSYHPSSIIYNKEKELRKSLKLLNE